MLEFPANKDKYKILVLGDIQAHGVIKAPEKKALKSLVEHARPDFVVFLGDMISGIGGYTKPGLRKIIRAILDSTVGTKIPFAIVSGNHESFTTIPYRKQIEVYREYPNCLTPSRRDRDCRKAYTLDLAGKNKQPLCRMLFIDCAGSKASRIGQVYKKTKADVLQYTRDVLFDSGCPPVLVFQHIIVPDVRRLLKTHSKDSTLGVRGDGPFRGKRVSLVRPEAGEMKECPSPAWDDTAQFPDWVKSRKVRAAVFAHDHVNSFEDELDEIKIIQCPGAGFLYYGDDAVRGARLLTISRSGQVSSIPYCYKDLK